MTLIPDSCKAVATWSACWLSSDELQSAAFAAFVAISFLCSGDMREFLTLAPFFPIMEK